LSDYPDRQPLSDDKNGLNDPIAESVFDEQTQSARESLTGEPSAANE